MDIHPVNHGKDKNQYCGPSAISIVTGMMTGEAARLLRYVSGKASIKGTSSGHMRSAFMRCGIHMIEKTVKQGPKVMVGGKVKKPTTCPTMVQWLADSVKDRTAGRVFLVSAGHHWQVISGRRFCCGRVGSPISITDKRANRRARVKAVYELKLPAGQKITIPPEARKGNSPASATAKEYAAFRAECRRHKLVWKKASDGYIEIEPSDDFPDGLTFMFDGWADAMDMLNRAFRHPEDISEDGYLTH